MRIAAVVALKSFPYHDMTIKQMRDIADKVFIRWDGRSGDPGVLQNTMALLGDRLGGITIVNGWGFPLWREECLRMMDDFKPDIVLCPDEDEVFDDTLREELDAFWYSDRKGMMFMYHPLVSCDDRKINGDMPYPPDPHMKAFKWEKGLSYFPYHGNAVVARYCSKSAHWQARTKIRHYSCFTKEMEYRKHWKSRTPDFTGVKGVTLYGFGPSADIATESIGEIWSVNNCYEVLTPEQMKLVTRIYEMHKFGERFGGKWGELWKRTPGKILDDRNKMKSGDGRTHVARLNEIAAEGRRIIMQEPHPLIVNSEAYPVEDVVKFTGLDWFMGTPCYMVADAIREGYTHIRIWGMDQLDYEHTLQRECFVGWMCYAVGRGIKISGSLTWLNGMTKRYGYDFGPEFDNWCEDILWRGHPIQVHYKEESRAVKGELFHK